MNTLSRLYSDVRDELCKRTVQDPLWSTMTRPQKMLRVQHAVETIFGAGGLPCNIVEAENAPIIRISSVFLMAEGIYISTHALPPESQRVVSWQENPNLVQYWVAATGESPSCYRN